MVDATLFQALRVKEALHRVHLDHGVTNRRTGSEGDAVACVLLV